MCVWEGDERKQSEREAQILKHKYLLRERREPERRKRQQRGNRGTARYLAKNIK